MGGLKIVKSKCRSRLERNVWRYRIHPRWSLGCIWRRRQCCQGCLNQLWYWIAGKLLHELKSLDFHPHEYLLATGSADKTVKFGDLETFKLIGSGGAEVPLRGVTLSKLSCPKIAWKGK
ncbi:unnamed protein product [Microthlaspi erraticum]|uniref:Uncharacterized protein n=1 Tax=Microthlaspi erraticum TaxID=1685480 RepID=A0A6D2JHG0_9BRAS|nr:unnamed protein product [Microthlaspi erraticum]